MSLPSGWFWASQQKIHLLIDVLLAKFRIFPIKGKFVICIKSTACRKKNLIADLKSASRNYTGSPRKKTSREEVCLILQSFHFSPYPVLLNISRTILTGLRQVYYPKCTLNSDPSIYLRFDKESGLFNTRHLLGLFTLNIDKWQASGDLSVSTPPTSRFRSLASLFSGHSLLKQNPENNSDGVYTNMSNWVSIRPLLSF